MKDRNLEVLEVLERRSEINQRSLARETRMALGLVNSCLRRLLRKGLVKMREAPGRRYVYYLTPKGFAEKSRLTYQYIAYSVGFYGEARERCHRLFESLQQEGVKCVALLGATDLAEIAYITLQEFPIEFSDIYDDGAVQNFFGHKVRALDDLKSEEFARDFDRLIYTRLTAPGEDASLAGIEFLEIF